MFWLKFGERAEVEEGREMVVPSKPEEAEEVEDLHALFLM